VEILSQEAKTESRLYEPVRKLAPSIFPFIQNWVDSKDSENQEENVFDQIKDALKVSN
jgi:membrane protein required for colicin V production